MRLRQTWLATVASLLLGSAALVGVAVAAGPTVRARAALAQQCPESFPATRDASNPLDLPQPPGANPLTGARFFVDGPAHGIVAGAIARLVGLRPSRFSDRESWASFKQRLDHGPLRRRLARHRGLAFRVHELEKIAAQPEVQRVSAFSRGGGPGAIFRQTQKLLCHNLTADPGSIPILNTYFLHPAAGRCPSPGALTAAGAVFKRRVDELAAALDRRPAVLLLEADAIGNSRCVQRAGSLSIWESYLSYEIGKLAALPHSVIYVEAGYSDANPVAYTANVLNAIGVGRTRGFYTNDTHLNWTIKEVRWATKVSERTGGAHFIVNTAQNGNGPLLNKHPRRQGIEDLCNPPHRALGPIPTTDTGFKLADAWLWTSTPGNSSGCGGGPPGGVFWTARAVTLAARANGRLGPGFPSRPY